MKLTSAGQEALPLRTKPLCSGEGTAIAWYLSEEARSPSDGWSCSPRVAPCPQALLSGSCRGAGPPRDVFLLARGVAGCLPLGGSGEQGRPAGIVAF